MRFFLLLVATSSFSLSEYIDQTCEDEICSLSTTAPHAKIPKHASVNGLPVEASDDCFDRHPECPDFVSWGECHKNPGIIFLSSVDRLTYV